MGLLRTTLGVGGWTAFGSALAYTVWTRKSQVTPIPQTDYIFGTTLIARFNPNNTPCFHDVCTRKVPLAQIKPELLGPGKEERLVERFSAGLWSGWGYAIQRRILERRYRGPETATQLWDVVDLESSSYPVGTQITDHLQVVSKTPESIMFRIGDTPRRDEVREEDGLLEVVAQVREVEGVVEFGIKSLLFNGLAQPDASGRTPQPVGAFVAWLHRQYDKVLMETAIGKCMK